MGNIMPDNQLILKQDAKKMFSQVIQNVNGNFFYQPRLSPDLSNILMLSYRLIPKAPNWNGIMVVPVFNKEKANGIIGVEIISPANQIITQVTIPLIQVEPHQPLNFSFPKIEKSENGTYEVRFFTRNNPPPVRIIEGRFLSPELRLRRFRVRLLCNLSFAPVDSKTIITQAETIGGWLNELPINLASAVGSSSFEDHYWTSGWQTANVQLITDLQPDDNILDIGCGVGRLAYGLYGWFKGEYVGTDIMTDAIEYCKKTFPRYQFIHMDIESPYYNPEGAMRSNEFDLPFQDESFDLVVLFSVYTHMLPDTFDRMTAEVQRVLRSRGRCFATFFIIDNKTDKAIFTLKHPVNEICWVESQESPESVVGYTHDFIQNTFSSFGLRIKEEYPGSWTGKSGLGLQDQILFVKD